MTFIDSFVMAVPTANREKFLKHCETADSWFLENGALRVVETWGDDVPKGEMTDFHRAVAAKEDETVCFGWIEWPDKATRDGSMGRMMSGEVIDDRFDPEKNPMPFDGKRMIFGGFTTVYDKTA
ncbi:MAG: DUF1428 domain-containing protein [Pseudomonadota bacterium]